MFGETHMPRFEWPYDNSNLGSESKLPRGRMAMELNPAYFTSVNLAGAGLAAEQAATKAREAAA